jgi:DNA-binding transcriptional regulator YiaG
LPNIASILKSEIVRLARKEIRAESEQFRKALAQYRSDIASLKRRVVVLERAAVRGKVAKTSVEQTSEQTSAVRFSAKGLTAQRKRLGLAGAELARLLGVSVQSVYNWEVGKSRPRKQQMLAIAEIRTMGKREASAKLAKLSG